MERNLSPVKTLLKQQPVTMISALLAVFSMFLVRPDKQYLGYVSYHTIGMLFILMIIMDALSSYGIFRIIGEKLLGKVHSTRLLALVLIFLCFFFSMFITNDIALLTFVPFTVELLTMADREEDMIPVIVLQTFAANLGSMISPIGNPHNLYLYKLSGMGALEFISMMVPYSILAGILLAAAPFLFVKKAQAENKTETKTVFEKKNTVRTVVYLLLFGLCLLVIFQVLEWYIVLIPVVIATLILNPGVFKKVNYSLLLTFICLFVFIGNVKRLEMVSELISTRLAGHEFSISLVTSQLISNVPTSLLLSGMSREYAPIIIGTDLGGLGTLISSMASLISFKLYGDRPGSNKGKYILTFSGYSILFLIFLVGLYLILGNHL